MRFLSKQQQLFFVCGYGTVIALVLFYIFQSKERKGIIPFTIPNQN